MADPTRNNPRKVSRIRTFGSDVELLRGSNSTTSTAPTPPASVTEESKIQTSTPVPLKSQSIFRAPETPVKIPDTLPKQIPEQVIAAQVQPILVTEKISQPIEIPTNSFEKESLIANEVNATLGLKTSDVQPDRLSVLETSDYDGMEGNIITDQKRKRFQLFPAMVEAVQGWISDEKATIDRRLEKRQKAVPRVRPVEERREILAKAAQRSALAPKDDHTQLTAKLPPITNKPQPEKALIIKEKTAAKPAGWNHFTDTEGKVFEEKITETLTPLVNTQTAPIPAKVATVIPTITIKSEPEKAPEVPEAVSTPISVVEPIPTPVATKSVVTPKPKKAKSPSIFTRLQPALMFVSVATIVLTATASGIGITWWLMGTFVNEPVTQTPTPTTLPTTSTPSVNLTNAVTLPLPNSRLALWQSLNSLAGGISDMGNILLTTNMGSAATAANILDVIKLNASGAFVRNIEEINFGGYNGSVFVVMRVTSFDTAFGGILSAEDMLANDFPVSKVISTSTYAFIDDLIQNRDIRVMKYESGEEGMVYGFINPKLLLIAANRNDFVDIASRLRQ